MTDRGGKGDGGTIAPSGDDGWLPRGLHVHGKSGLTSVLREWLSKSDAATIGDTSGFQGRIWVTAEIEGYRVRLDADTTHDAVQKVVDEPAAQPTRPWRIVRNQRGQITKVQPTARPITGWYAYIHPPLPRETEI